MINLLTMTKKSLHTFPFQSKKIKAMTTTEETS